MSYGIYSTFVLFLAQQQKTEFYMLMERVKNEPATCMAPSQPPYGQPSWGQQTPPQYRPPQQPPYGYPQSPSQWSQFPRHQLPMQLQQPAYWFPLRCLRCGCYNVQVKSVRLYSNGKEMKAGFYWAGLLCSLVGGFFSLGNGGLLLGFSSGPGLFLMLAFINIIFDLFMLTWIYLQPKRMQYRCIACSNQWV